MSALQRGHCQESWVHELAGAGTDTVVSDNDGDFQFQNFSQSASIEVIDGGDTPSDIEGTSGNNTFGVTTGTNGCSSSGTISYGGKEMVDVSSVMDEFGEDLGGRQQAHAPDMSYSVALNFEANNLSAAHSDLEPGDNSKLPIWTKNFVGIGFRHEDKDVLARFNEALAGYIGSEEMMAKVTEHEYREVHLPDETTTEWACANR